MQISRLFAIVYLLIDKKRMTANALAAHFEVSKRTILRDVETLSMAGVPIYTVKGKGGGISLLDHYVLDKTTITEEEQNQILMALQSLGSTRHIDANQLLSKLGALFQKTDTTWIEVDFSRWGNMTPDKEKFELLKNAILNKQRVSFTYPSASGQITERTVCPLKLVFKSTAWYVQAYCLSKQAYRTFKVSRMLHSTVLAEGFAEGEFSPPPLEAAQDPTGSLISLKLQFSPRAAFRVYDEFDSKYVTRQEDGSLTVAIQLPNDDWLYRFLVSFGTSVRVVEPQSVKQHLLTQIRMLEKFYSEDIT